MATTVIAAFNEFMKETVNLKKADTDKPHLLACERCFSPCAC
ncbi:hypothetical protein [Atlantibacter hermannii]|nr:hypothetical protein [Atlantibacter hermannii]WIF57205.1 hypothetical protein QN094_14480 [Atlantibacter hermannii]